MISNQSIIFTSKNFDVSNSINRDSKATEIVKLNIGTNSCGCSENIYVSLIESSQTNRNCNCDNEESDSQTESINNRRYVVGSDGTVYDCYMAFKNIVVSNHAANGEYPDHQHTELMYELHCNKMEPPYNPGPIDINPVNPIEGENHNSKCPTCLGYKKFYNAMKESILSGKPYSGNAEGARLLQQLKIALANMIYGIGLTIIHSSKDINFDDVLNFINNLANRSNDKMQEYFDKLLLELLDTMVQGVTNEDVQNLNTSVCKSMIATRLDLLNYQNGQFEKSIKFDVFNNFSQNASSRELIQDGYPFLPSKLGSIYSEYTFGLAKKEASDCFSETYKVFKRYSDGPRAADSYWDWPDQNTLPILQ